MSNINTYGITDISVSNKRNVTSKSNTIFGLAFPIGSQVTTGGYFAKNSSISLIKGAVKQLLSTKKGERVMHPSFGVDLERYLFQPLDEDTFEDIKTEILYAFKRYIVGATIVKLSVFPADSVSISGGNGLIITLTLKLNRDQLTVFDVQVEIG